MDKRSQTREIAKRSKAIIDSGAEILLFKEVVYERVPRNTLYVLLQNYSRIVIDRHRPVLPWSLFASFLVARATGTFTEAAFSVSGDAWKGLFSIATVISFGAAVYFSWKQWGVNDDPYAAIDKLPCEPLNFDETSSSATSIGDLNVNTATAQGSGETMML